MNFWTFRITCLVHDKCEPYYIQGTLRAFGLLFKFFRHPVESCGRLCSFAADPEDSVSIRLQKAFSLTLKVLSFSVFSHALC
jgi:hypothetical protein